MDALSQEKSHILTPSLSCLFDQQLRETADAVWQQGINEQSLGTLIRASMLRMGLNTNNIFELLSVSKSAFINFLHDNKYPTKGWHGDALYMDLVSLLQQWEQTSGTPGKTGLDAGADPWLNESKQTQLYESFAKAKEKHIDRRNPPSLPSRADADSMIAEKRLAFAKVTSTKFAVSYPESQLSTMENIEGFKQTGARATSTGGRGA